LKNCRERVAVIPVREGSQRVSDKNFKSFYNGKNLLEPKIEHLLNESCYDKIYVSSDSEKATKIAEKTGVCFLYREPYLCSSEVRWSDVIFGVTASIPGANPIISWVHTTSPLHTYYKKPLLKFTDLISEYDSLVAVTPFQEFVVTERGRPLNYHWGPWHDYSQDLDTLYKVTGALFIAQKQDILKWRYLIGVKPYLFKVDRDLAVDVDTEQDYSMAQMFYANRSTV